MTETVERLFVRNPEHNTSDTVKSWLIADCYQGVVAVRGENVAVAGVVVCLHSLHRFQLKVTTD